MTQATLFPDGPPETPAIGVARSPRSEPSKEATVTASFELDFTENRPPAVQAKIEDGMRRADENADGRWRHVFDACVLAAARKKPEITSDDVLAEIEALPNPPSTHNLAAIGPAMRRAWKMGIIAPTEKVLRSERIEKKGNYHKVWMSKYYTARGEQ